MVAQPHRSRMSVEEYLTLERTNTEIHYEFIDGHVYMLAGGTADHPIISANIIRELSLALRGSPCRVYTSDVSDPIPSEGMGLSVGVTSARWVEAVLPA